MSVRQTRREYAAHFAPDFPQSKPARWAGVYLQGLLLDGERKSIEPLSRRVALPPELAVKDPEQALQQFANQSPWDEQRVLKRYRAVMARSFADPKGLFVTISQSGETADTLAALAHAKSMGYEKTLTICNVPESALMRQSRLRYLTRAGPEIGVASTKAFTTQLASLFLLTLVLARCRGKLSDADESRHLAALRHLPAALQVVLQVEERVADWAKRFAGKNHALFLGRGIHYPIALEGALKLKEISYIHAEAYAAGELKHGPLALVDADMPVVTIAPNDVLLEKLKSNMQEVRARGGELYVFADADTRIPSATGVHVIRLPEHYGLLSPILHVVPLQLLAYHTALARGTDVDKPRNLAKSVTVE